MTKAIKINRVVVQIHAPSENDPGRVTEGRYTVEDGVVTLTDDSGTPVRDRSGKTYSKKLEPDEDAYAVAGRLAKQFRRARCGGERVEGFSRKLHYPKLGIV